VSSEPLTDEQRDGVLGAIVVSLAATGDAELLELSDSLRRGGQLTAFFDDDDCVHVSLAVPPGRSFRNVGELEVQVFDFVSRAVATCGHYVRTVRITLALARSGWREGPTKELPIRFGGRFERELDPLKYGGFGVIYKAIDLSTNAEVALKVLRLPENEGVQMREQSYLRFRREMQLMMDLRHPNLMQVLWYGEEESGVLWYAMPLAEGCLTDRLAEFPADSNRILSVFSSICDGVAYLHERDIVHRDLSPENVLCLPDGSWVVSDLGLAFDLDRELTQLTTTGMTMGKVGYRPPDAESQMTKNAATSWDIFSLGQLLADMCGGKRYSERNGSVPDCLFRPAIVRACNADPSRRYASVRVLLDECRKLVELSTQWEGPDEKQLRFIDSLHLEDFEATKLLASEVERGGKIEPYVSALSGMSKSAVVGFAKSSPEELRVLTLALIEEMPGQWIQFAQLDQMANFVVTAAEALKDDIVSERALIWLLETGAEYNRWYVQGLAEEYLRRLAVESLDVVTRALRNASSQAIPEDLDWLHPAARPTGMRGGKS
jgi:hypothetical protein